MSSRRSPTRGGYHAGRHDGDTNAVTLFEPFVQMLMKHRIVHDFAAALVAHGLLERFPRLRVAYIENGGMWVGPLLHGLQLMAAQNPGMFKDVACRPVHRALRGRSVGRGHVEELAAHLPVERILFGSDWPHAEGMAHPKDFLQKVSCFAPAAQRRIMYQNAQELTLF